MTRKKMLTIAFLIGMVAVLGVGAFTFFNVRAQSNNESLPAWSGGPPLPGFKGRMPAFGMGGEALAQALGIRVEELQAAQQKAAEAALEKAVAEGLITQKQADWLRSNPRRFPAGQRLFAWFSQNGIDMDALMAEALGISVEQLAEARQKAVEIAIEQAVTEGKITQEQADLMKARRALFSNQNFINAMRSAFEAAVKKAVQEGVITQAQADLILKQMQSQPNWQGMPGFVPPLRGHADDVPPFGDEMPFPLVPAP
ncbi:MAG: hypothetical protein DDG59_15525 [Anaerolineae bacterium]|nr:MAG: hypothetical protein DDG59_15525 [Anaerolineae bacterium]